MDFQEYSTQNLQSKFLPLNEKSLKNLENYIKENSCSNIYLVLPGKHDFPTKYDKVCKAYTDDQEEFKFYLHICRCNKDNEFIKKSFENIHEGLISFSKDGLRALYTNENARSQKERSIPSSIPFILSFLLNKEITRVNIPVLGTRQGTL